MNPSNAVRRHRALKRDGLPDFHASALDTATPGTYGAKRLWPMAKITAAGVTAVIVAVALAILQRQGVDTTTDVLGLGLATWEQAINVLAPLAVAYLWPRSPVDNVPVHDPLERVPPDSVED